MPESTLQPSLQKPALVQAPPEGEAPQLRARKCSCGHVQFPPQPHGCERCGAAADASEPVALSSRGAVIAVTTVFVHPKLKAPYTLARVLLEEGVAIDARVHGEPVALGARVRGALVPQQDERGTSLEFVFTGEASQ